MNLKAVLAKYRYIAWLRENIKSLNREIEAIKSINVQLYSKSSVIFSLLVMRDAYLEELRQLGEIK